MVIGALVAYYLSKLLFAVHFARLGHNKRCGWLLPTAAMLLGGPLVGLLVASSFTLVSRPKVGPKDDPELYARKVADIRRQGLSIVAFPVVLPVRMIAGLVRAVRHRDEPQPVRGTVSKVDFKVPDSWVEEHSTAKAQSEARARTAVGMDVPAGAESEVAEQGREMVLESYVLPDGGRVVICPMNDMLHVRKALERGGSEDVELISPAHRDLLDRYRGDAQGTGLPAFVDSRKAERDDVRVDLVSGSMSVLVPVSAEFSCLREQAVKVTTSLDVRRVYGDGTEVQFAQAFSMKTTSRSISLTYGGQEVVSAVLDVNGEPVFRVGDISLAKEKEMYDRTGVTVDSLSREDPAELVSRFMELCGSPENRKAAQACLETAQTALQGIQAPEKAAKIGKSL